MKSVIKQHLDNLQNKKNVVFEDTEYKIELDLMGYITQYSYCNFVRETKHYFRIVDYSYKVSKQYRESNYREWKERYILLRKQSFQILDFILMMESSLFSVILETCLENDLNENDKFIEKIENSKFVRLIDKTRIERDLKKKQYTENFNIQNYIKEYTYECMSRLTYSETIDLLGFMFSNFENIFNTVCAVLLKHVEYKQVFSQMKMIKMFLIKVLLEK